MGCGFNYMYETCWCMQAKTEGEGVCAAAGCMWTCLAEDLSVQFALWLDEGYKFCKCCMYA